MGWGAHCPPAVEYSPYYFFSRYPLERTKLFNLQNLLTPGSWFAYFITIIFVIIREGFIQKKRNVNFHILGPALQEYLHYWQLLSLLACFLHICINLKGDYQNLSILFLPISWFHAIILMISEI